MKNLGLIRFEDLELRVSAFEIELLGSCFQKPNPLTGQGIPSGLKIQVLGEMLSFGVESVWKPNLICLVLNA